MTNEGSTVPTPADVAARDAGRTFTQAEVNEIVQSRLKNMKADYEQLQARAAAAGELESRSQELASELSSLRLETLRVRIAAEFGIGGEDRDVLLTATDEATLRMQAERFVSYAPQSLSGGNVAPREGRTVEAPSAKDGSLEAFVSELFDRDPI